MKKLLALAFLAFTLTDAQAIIQAHISWYYKAQTTIIVGVKTYRYTWIMTQPTYNGVATYVTRYEEWDANGQPTQFTEADPPVSFSTPYGNYAFENRYTVTGTQYIVTENKNCTITVANTGLYAQGVDMISNGYTVDNHGVQNGTVSGYTQHINVAAGSTYSSSFGPSQFIGSVAVDH